MAYTTIDKPDDYFNTKLYTGNGGTLVNTGVGFQPDLVWVKSRTEANSHVWFDSIRTFAGGKEIQSNNTGAEGASDSAGYGYISAVSSDGFTAQAGTTAGDYTNVSSQNYVAWNWLANGTASSNTDGSITSSVSANTTSGFSIVSYTGTGSASTIGHGLSSTPQVYIIKNRTNARNWQSYHEPLGNQAYLRLNTTGAVSTSASIWNNTSPTSSVFSIGTSAFDAVNANGDNYIAYCFAEKKGFSKFGSYTGNGSADGTFIYTGFKPAFVLTKSSSNSGASYNWQMWDNKRNTYNAVDTQLRPNTSESDNPDVSYSMDFVSNGFKMRGTNTNQNGSGANYIYMAFAENPFVSSTGVPATAR